MKKYITGLALLLSATVFCQPVKTSFNLSGNPATPGVSSNLELLALNGFVSINDFGAVPNDGSDDAGAINSAFAYMETPAGKGKVLTGKPGVYDTYSTIHMGSGNGYNTIVFYSPALNYDWNETKGITIFGHAPDQQILNIQSALRSKLINIHIHGINSANAGYSPGMTNPANYVATGLGIANGRYKMLAGVTVDAYTGSQPAGGFTNAPNGWNKPASSIVDIEGCKVTNVVACIVVAPSGSNEQSEFVRVWRTSMQYALYGLSVCPSQSRQTSFLEGFSDVIYTAFTNKTHGAQQGRIGEITGHVSGYQLMDFGNNAINGPCKITVYGESIVQIGYTGDDNGNMGEIVFERTQMAFNHAEIGYVPPAIATGTRAVFNYCLFTGETATTNFSGFAFFNYCSFNKEPSDDNYHYVYNQTDVTINGVRNYKNGN